MSIKRKKRRPKEDTTIHKAAKAAFDALGEGRGCRR